MPANPTPTNSSDFPYLRDRLDDQIDYFERSAAKNQTRYKFLKRTAIVSSVLTTVLIAIAFTVPNEYRYIPGIAALVLSALVLATYQWEEFENYGAKWEKFRLVAEQLKSERFMYITGAGRYTDIEVDGRERELVEKVEGIIRGTDISYFSLMVDPGRRIEKRLGPPNV